MIIRVSTRLARARRRFRDGTHSTQEGITLRVLLSRLLNCQPMRVSKKYSGEAWATHGKRPYTPARYEAVPSQPDAAELGRLEGAFHRSLRPGAQLTTSLLGTSGLPTPVGARQWLHSDTSGGGEARAAKRPRAEAPAPAPPAAAEAAAEAAAQVMIATLHEALAGPRPPTLAELRARAPAVYSVVARAAEASLAPAPAAPAPASAPPQD